MRFLLKACIARSKGREDVTNVRSRTYRRSNACEGESVFVQRTYRRKVAKMIGSARKSLIHGLCDVNIGGKNAQDAFSTEQNLPIEISENY